MDFFKKEAIKARVLSFIWRLGAYVVVAVLTFIVNNIGDLQLPQYAVVITTLLAGELTKYLNNKYALGTKVLGAFKK